MQAVKTSNTSTDQADVITTARDYFEGWFDGDALEESKGR
jgi:hypothetical protein